MKTILLSAFCTLALNVQAMEVKKDTIDKYVIDKQVIERFDGTQLEGKTISKYIIAYKNVGDKVEKNHIIFTFGKSNPTNHISTDQILNGTIYEGLILVDGKEVNRQELKTKVKSGTVASINFYKPDSKVAKSYGEKGQKGVLTITTKANKNHGNIYLVDGRRVEKEEVDKLSPEKIASMNISKKEGNSVVVIVTKK